MATAWRLRGNGISELIYRLGCTDIFLHGMEKKHDRQKETRYEGREYEDNPIDFERRQQATQ